MRLFFGYALTLTRVSKRFGLPGSSARPPKNLNVSLILVLYYGKSNKRLFGV